jgi:hypothetical protein
MGSLSDFHTREAANEGARLDLHLPDGKESGDYLIVRGIDSDEFKAAQAREARRMMLLGEISEKERIEQARISSANMLASLIVSWSFEDQLTQESAAQWLTEAPQIGDAIDRLASNRRLYFKKKSTS